MLLQVILEGLGLGALLILVCAVGIRKGAVGMVHLYPMGQPFASVQPGLYAGLQRSKRPVGQRLFPPPCPGRRRDDEHADRKDRIWREKMKHLHFKECHQTRIDIEKRMCRSLVEWKGAK